MSGTVRRSQVALLSISLLVLVGMWFERYMIVVTSLHRDFLPSSWGMYRGTIWDWMTFIGTVGLFLSLLFLFIRFLPMISIFEMRTILPQAEVVEEWLGIVGVDGALVSAPPDWSRLVRLLAMGEVAPRTAHEEERIVTDFLRRIAARFTRPDSSATRIPGSSPSRHRRLSASNVRYTFCTTTLSSAMDHVPSLISRAFSRKPVHFTVIRLFQQGRCPD